MKPQVARSGLPAVLAALALAVPAGAASGVPEPGLYSPQPVPPSASEPEPPQIPPPNSYFNAPCGVAVDSGGRFYVADHHHDAVDVYAAPARRSYLTQIRVPDPDRGPCAVALAPGGDLYVADYHGAVRRYAPDSYPPEAGPHPSSPDPPEMGTEYTPEGTIDPGRATGLAVDGAAQVYVAHRDRVSVYDLGGSLQREIGSGQLGEAYGVAVSGFEGDGEHAATAGDVYLADAQSGTVKVFDVAGNPLAPLAGPPGGFASLRDASLAVDDATGEVYVLDDTQPAHTETPRGRVYAFAADGGYEGHLKYDVVDGSPSGLAVDNSGGSTQSRVYVTSGNTLPGGLYVYPPGAAGAEPPRAPTIPPPLAGAQPVSSIPVGGGADGGAGIPCEGDACRALPPEPVDPTLTTLLEGLGNPAVRYRRALRDCRPALRSARRLARSLRRAGRAYRRARHGKPRRAGRLRVRAGRLRRHARRAHRVARRCRRINHGGKGEGGASASSAPRGREAPVAPAVAGTGAPPVSLAPRSAALSAPDAGLGAHVWANGGESATLAGSHPYSLQLSLGLGQSGGERDLREARFELPAGLLANPAALGLCPAADFATPRSSPFEASRSGESCPDASQVGTLEVSSGAQTRRFGLFDLAPADGTALELGAAPFGVPLRFEGSLDATAAGTRLVLRLAEVPQGLGLGGLALELWGTPWAASHDTERGACLNEEEPDFAWSKCSVGEPLTHAPRAFLTLPTECGRPLAFTARARTWQGAASETEAVSRDSEGAPALLEGCETLRFDPEPQAFLTTTKASSPTGFGFRLTGTEEKLQREEEALLDPDGRVSAPVRRIALRLPEGVTINPSAGAGLDVCTPAQLAAETPFNKPGDGCPSDSKLGAYRLRVPFYKGLLEGSVYLATPRDNPFGSLLAVYLVAKSAERGILVRVAGKLAADPESGDLTASFEDLPQLPYSEVLADFHPGQRSLLVSPPACGPAVTRTQVTPWTGTSASPPGVAAVTSWDISSGSDAGPCPSGATPPFSPGVVAGGVNSNVGSYTPYFVHLSRGDDEQEITSYSLTLPEGIVGKLAGIPFCPDAAIAAARRNGGFAETADPSCPEASRVGRTLTGYGVGRALTYAPGKIYLAGPYNGQPLSLVTVNAATVGPFDLGTIVVRSAFSVDPRTAQLRIDSRSSDPIPHILDGIPLHLRDVRVYMDRDRFTRNPTGCEASELISTLTGAGGRLGDPSDDSTSTATEHFQLLNCLTLGFRPRLGLRLRGATRRGAFPGLLAVFAARGGDADLKRIAVTMPPSLFLAQNHIRTVCTRVQFAAQRCPRGSIYGTAAADTPLFDEPLRGPVLLRSSDHKLPDLIADLRAGEVRIVLEGRIGPSKRGGIRAFFDGLPDAPLNRFAMRLAGGRRGLLVNSVNICARPPAANVKALAHNNRGAIFATKLRGNCKEQGGARKRRAAKRRRSGR